MGKPRTQNPREPGGEPRVGELVRARRRGLGWSLAKLAAHTRCPRGYLSEVETGKRGVPGDEILGKIEWAMMMEAGSLVRPARWARAMLEGGQTVKAEVERLREVEAKAQKLAMLIEEGASAEVLRAAAAELRPRDGRGDGRDARPTRDSEMT